MKILREEAWKRKKFQKKINLNQEKSKNFRKTNPQN